MVSLLWLLQGSATVTYNLQMTIWEKVFWPNYAASLPYHKGWRTPESGCHSSNGLGFQTQLLVPPRGEGQLFLMSQGRTSVWL